MYIKQVSENKLSFYVSFDTFLTKLLALLVVTQIQNG